MVRSTTRDDESAKNASVSVPDYRETGVDLVDVSPGDRIEFTTTTKRSNGVPLRKAKTLTVDDVTVDEVEDTELVEVDPSWLPDDGPFGCDDDVAAASVPRDVTKTKVSVVAIDDGTRYTLRQTDTGFVRVSSCEQSDYVDQNERGEFNAVARSNVSHGTLSSWSHTPVVTDGGTVDDDPNRYDDPRAAIDAAEEGDAVTVAYDSTRGGEVTKTGEVTWVDGYLYFDTGDERADGSPYVYKVDSHGRVESQGPKRDVKVGSGAVVTIAADADRDAERAATDGGIDDVPEVVDVDEDDRYPSVERWDWQVVDTGVIELIGYDADGDRVARRTFKHTSTDARVEVRDDGTEDWVDADDHDDGGWSPSEVFKPDDLRLRDVREDDVVEVRYDPPRDAHPRQTLRFRIVSVAGGTAGVVSGPTPGGDRIRVWRDDREVTRNGTTLGDVVSFEVVGRVPDEDDDVDRGDGVVTDGGIDRCDECGHYAAHTFDHAPSCTSYTPIEAEPDVDGTDLRSRDHDTLRARLAALEDAKARAVDTGSERRYRRIDDREEAVRAELVRRAATREGAV